MQIVSPFEWGTKKLKKIFNMGGLKNAYQQNKTKQQEFTWGNTKMGVLFFMFALLYKCVQEY